MPGSCFRFNTQNNAVSSFICTNSLSSNVITKQHIGGLIWGTPVMDNEGNIYIGSTNRHFYCLNPRGHIKWTYQLTERPNSLVDSAAAIHPVGFVVVPGGDGYLHALKLETGQLLWKSETANNVPDAKTGEIVNAFEGNVQIDKYGRIYAGCDNDYMYCYDARGKLIWSYKTDMMIWSCVAMNPSNTAIYFGSLDFHIYCLNASDGAFINKYKTDGEIKSSPVFYNNKVYVCNSNGKLYSFTSNLQLIYQIDIEGGIYSTPVIKDNILIITTMNGIMYAIYADTGNIFWKKDLLYYICASPMITLDDYVIIGNSVGMLIALNLFTGDIIASIKLSDKNLNSSPNMTENNIIIGGYDGYVYCVSNSFIKTHKQIPDFSCNNDHYKIIYNNHVVLLRLITCHNSKRNINAGIGNINLQSDIYNSIISSDLKYIILVPKISDYLNKDNILHINTAWFNKTSNWLYDRFLFNSNRFLDNIKFKSQTNNPIKSRLPKKWNIGELRVLQPVILDTYIPAALNSLGFISYLHQDNKKLRFIPAIPDDNDFKRLPGQTEFDLDVNIYNNQLIMTSDLPITFSFMGGTMTFLKLRMFAVIDPQTLDISGDMYAVSSCLNIKGNGQNYKFSSSIINQLCDQTMRIHIVASFKGTMVS